MFYVVARNVWLKVTAFSTAFYRIYLAQSVADYVVYAWSPLFARFQFFNVIPPTAYDVNTVGIAQSFISTYGFYFLYFTYVTIAANRYTAILRPFKHDQLWSPQRLIAVYVVLGLLPVPLAAIRLWFVYKIVPMDGGYSLSNTEKGLGVVSGYISAVTCVGTCLSTVVLNLHTFFAYRKLSQNNQRAYREEYHLLGKLQRLGTDNEGASPGEY
ncbi:hypothetical protein AAVH_25880 [Aphelenchoides avenae]|nr:hypothetical protein AAVH_25880 [Aphelenchus avenae]